MPKKRRRAGANALWRGRRPGVSPVMLALIVAVGAIVAVGGMLLTQRAAREDAAAPSGLQISQIVADNASTLITETGYVPDLIEVRNAGGAANALAAADLALAGAAVPIPLDEMLAAMLAVGRRLPAELRETALGGCAATPTACRLCGGAALRPGKA